MNTGHGRVRSLLCWAMLPIGLVVLTGCEVANGAGSGLLSPSGTLAQDLQGFIANFARQVLAALLL